MPNTPPENVESETNLSSDLQRTVMGSVPAVGIMGVSTTGTGPLNEDALEAAAAKVYPHHWNGDMESKLAQLPQFSPEQAAESASRIRTEKLEEMRDHVSAYLALAQHVVNSVEELDTLPVGSRVVIGDYYLAHASEIVDDGQWIDLGNGCYMDDEDLQRLLEIEPALVTLRPEVPGA